MKRIICSVLFIVIILSVFLLSSCASSCSSEKQFIVLNSPHFQKHESPEKTVIVNRDYISNILATKFEGQECFVVEYIHGGGSYHYYLTAEEATSVFEQLGIEKPEDVFFGE